ncbi:MAG: hypothetical protein NVS3B16_16610 [Vulcanimicrobiaceae bacterium]
MTFAPRPKRRSRPSLGVRLRRFWVVGVIVVGLALWGGFALATSPAFRLHELTVTGLSHATRDDVLARASIDRNANVWLLDGAAIARRIEASPYVLTARVHRRPLGNVWIDVVERTADGCVRSRGGAALTVDRDDRVLERGCSDAVALAYELRAATDVAAGRFVRDPELPALQRDGRALAAMGDRFRALRHDAYGQLEADLQDGIRIRFGDDRDLERKQRLIGPILAQLGPRATGVRAVDLRAPATPVVEFVPRPRPSAGPAGALASPHRP